MNTDRGNLAGVVNGLTGLILGRQVFAPIWTLSVGILINYTIEYHSVVNQPDLCIYVHAGVDTGLWKGGVRVTVNY